MGNKGLFLGLLIFIGVFKPQAVLAADVPCGFNQVKILNATKLEIQRTCESLNKVINYFKPVGISVDPQVTYVFEDKVEVTISGEVYSLYGYFDTDTREIHMTHFNSWKSKNRTPWGFPWNETMVTSFLVHETTHMYIIEFMGKSYKQLSHAWHEAIAYTVQFEMMNAQLKNKIVKTNGGGTLAAFEEIGIINNTFFEMNPEVFAIKSYLSLSAWGGPEFIKNLLEGKITGVSND